MPALLVQHYKCRCITGLVCDGLPPSKQHLQVLSNARGRAHAQLHTTIKAVGHSHRTQLRTKHRMPLLHASSTHAFRGFYKAIQHVHCTPRMQRARRAALGSHTLGAQHTRPSRRPCRWLPLGAQGTVPTPTPHRRCWRRLTLLHALAALAEPPAASRLLLRQRLGRCHPAPGLPPSSPPPDHYTPVV